MTASRYDKIAFVASNAPDAMAACERLSKTYGNAPEAEANAVVALGGDGFMLTMLHKFRDKGIPIYGMHRGTIGFLMNEFREEGLHERLAVAQSNKIHPLMMEATDDTGKVHRAPALNEVSLLRQSYQAAKLRIHIDGKVRMEELICDGMLVATPVGSTAYNLSAHGPILPLAAPFLALTPISPFRPRRWRGAMVPDRADIEIEILEKEKRPVSAVADHFEVRSVVRVAARMDMHSSVEMLFDPGHSLDERILNEQFGY
jgi:NAD+ kinase